MPWGSQSATTLVILSVYCISGKKVGYLHTVGIAMGIKVIDAIGNNGGLVLGKTVGGIVGTIIGITVDGTIRDDIGLAAMNPVRGERHNWDHYGDQIR